MTPLLGHSITYRIAVGAQAGRKVFTLQKIQACDEPFDDGVGKVAGFSLHAGVAARAYERKKLERLCRHISRPAVSEKRLKRVFNIDIETCSACGGAVKVIACIEDPVVIKQILDHLEHRSEASEPKAHPESRAPPTELHHGLFD